MKYGLVLAGGGVRGAFHMGVWKALKKMNIGLAAVAGTSIGAINGALIAQDEYEAAQKLWRKISAEDIIDLPENISGDRNILSFSNLFEIIKEMYTKSGFDMSPLDKIVRSVIDEDKLRNSPVDFGIAVYSLTNKKGMYKFADEIPRGSLVDYIMASASILTAKEIHSEKFSDGGMFDNMPVRMLTEKGIKDIITVDVKGIGITRGFPEAGKNIIQIRSKTPQTGIMEFDKGGIARSIDEGYLACLKAFGRVAGDIYCFRTDDYIKAREKYSADMISGLEKAAKIFDIDPLSVYTFDGLKDMVIEQYQRRLIAGKPDIKKGFDKIRKEGDNALVIWLTEVIESGRSDFLSERLSVLGAAYEAADAILYFKN